MSRILVVLVVILVVSTIQVTIAEDLAISKAYDDFLTRYNRKNSLEIVDVNQLTTRLLDKFNCGTYGTADCDTCLNSMKLQMSGLIGTTVEREEFKNVSIVLLCYLMDLPQFCTYNSIPDANVCYEYLLQQTSNMNANMFDEFLRTKMKLVYSPETHISNYSLGLQSVECVDAKILIDKYKPKDSSTWNVESLSQLSSDVISSFFNDAPIGCEYPYPSYFIDQLYNTYSINNEFNVEALTKLMIDVGLAHEHESETAKTRKRRSAAATSYEKCYTPQQLIEIHLMSNNSISKQELTILSPSIIYLHNKAFCDVKAEADELQKPRVSNAEKYGYGTIAVAIVSVLGLLGIFLLPCFNKGVYQEILTCLTALAVSTLFCDAMLHILPVILGLEEEGENSTAEETDTIEIPNHIYRICVAIFALYLFWLLEMIFYKLTGTHAHPVPPFKSHGDLTNEDADTQNQSNNRGQITHRLNSMHNGQVTPTTSYNSVSNSNGASSNNNFVFPSVPLAFNADIHPIGEKLEDDETLKKRNWCSFRHIKATAWILLISDSIHNFADGLAIGVSFSESISLGISTSIAIICHEIPHELGNYAVLVKCGMSHIQALLLNFLSACSAFIGFYVGVSAASDPEVSLWIFSITAGMFFYISLVDLLPHLMTEGHWKWRTFIIINIFMWVGFSIMFLLVIYEDKIKI